MIMSMYKNDIDSSTLMVGDKKKKSLKFYAVAVGKLRAYSGTG